jgi:predicted O-methyltransferase YrrM
VDNQKTFWEKVNCQIKGEFQIGNDYFTSPDAEVLTAMVELFKPEKIIEIGSGNSTRLFRAALDEFQANSRIISIDPFPRVETDKSAHEVIRKKLEEIKDEPFFDQIKPGDFLFIDSSHEVKPGNDVVELLLNVLPRLHAGVLIHIHDIFLPYDYPKEWIIQNRWPWTEQYLVQALLQGSDEYEVLWAGHYYQKTMSKFRQHFPYWKGKDASSLWLRKK